jgi:hypothetical protein
MNEGPCANGSTGKIGDPNTWDIESIQAEIIAQKRSHSELMAVAEWMAWGASTRIAISISPL